MSSEVTRLIVHEKNGQIQVLLDRPGQSKPESYGPPRPFEAPLSGEEQEDLRWYLEDYLRAPYGVYADQGKGIADRLADWGERLFEAVFPCGRPHDAYLLARQNRRCQVWLSSTSPAFLSLPWELLREAPRDLALEMAGFYRTTSTDEPTAEKPTGEQLRVLMIIARPAGKRDIDYQMIARPLLERLAPVAGEVDLEVLRPPTFDELKRRLVADEPFHVLHFDGHGTFGEEWRYGSPQGFLLFENKKGQGDMVSAEILGPVLSEARIPLLVLNACRSGMMAAGARPEAAVATRLLAGGAAATVAMGYKVNAVAAAEFMAAFYEALFAGRPVSEAVTAGRQQMRKEAGRPSPKGTLPLADWIVPVHYSRQEVAFPELARRSPRGELSLDDVLSKMRRPTPPPVEGVHMEGDLWPEGGIFFGRDAEFLELERALRTRRVIVLHGVGGTGKTELARGFARWLQASGGLDRQDLVFFHSFEPGIASFGLDGVLAAVGLRLFGADFGRLTSGDRRAKILVELRRTRMLLIWDNFETVHSLPAETAVTRPLEEEGREAVKDFLAEVARKARGGVIVTSRSSESWLGDFYPFKVGGLDAATTDEFADALLAASPKAQTRREDAAYPKLLELLGGHPLSLRLILPRLAEVNNVQEIVDALESGDELADRFVEGEGRLRSLDVSLHYSFRHLAAEVQERLLALTIFEGVADVNVLMIFSQVEGVPPRFAGLDREAWQETLEASVAAGLLTGLGAGMYRLHPTLPHFLLRWWRQLAEESFEREQEAVWAASTRAHAELGTLLSQQIETGSAETAFEVLKIERRSLGRAAATALADGLFGEAQQILQPLNELWNSEGLFEEARGWVDRCREAIEDSDGKPPAVKTPERDLWLFMMSSQANRLHRAGQIDTAEAEYGELRRHLEDSESEDGHLATAYHQLGMAAQDRGDLSVAEDWYRQSLEFEKTLGNRPGMANSYHQLGVVARHRGDLKAAEVWFRKALEIKEELGNRPLMASSYHGLGMVAQDRGDLKSAEDLYRKAKDINKALGNRLGTASSYHQLGTVAQDRGDLKAAEDWYHKALDINEALGNRPGMASSYHQLGTVAQHRRDLRTAEDWYRKALKIQEELGDRSSIALLYHNLGMAAQDRGDLMAAENLYRRALEINEELGNRPDTALTYGQMGLLCEKQGNIGAALDWTVRCVTLFSEFPHPSTGPASSHLARLTAELGIETLAVIWQRVTGSLLPEAVRRFVEEAALATATDVDPTPQEAQLYNEGNRHRREGRLDQAIDCYSKAIGLNPGFFQAIHNRGEAYSAKEQYVKAISDYSAVIRLRPNDAVPFSNRANAHAYCGSFDDAIADYNEALRINPHHAPSLSGRGVTYAEKKEYARAIVDCDMALEIEPRNPCFHYNIALCLEGLGRESEAMDAYRQFLELVGPETREATQVLTGSESDPVQRARERLAVLEREGMWSRWINLLFPHDIAQTLIRAVSLVVGPRREFNDRE